MVNNDYSSSEGDEWDTAGDDLVVLPVVSTPTFAKKKNDDTDVAIVDNNNDGWDVKLPDNGETSGSGEEEKEEKAGEPMIIVDMTAMDHSIHNKFDINSVNDPDKVSKLRKQIESNYNDGYAKTPELLANGTVIPYGSSVYRLALIQLRRDKPGHYYCAIFPSPKKK